MALARFFLSLRERRLRKRMFTFRIDIFLATRKCGKIIPNIKDFQRTKTRVENFFLLYKIYKFIFFVKEIPEILIKSFFNFCGFLLHLQNKKIYNCKFVSYLNMFYSKYVYVISPKYQQSKINRKRNFKNYTLQICTIITDFQ